MAKYTVTHKCGHEKEHNLIGPRRSREWKLERLESELCDECEAAERERQNAEAAAANREMGLPELIGTENQVGWAESIRHRFMDELDDMMERYKDETVTEEGQVIIDTLMAQTRASWWIDHRHLPLEQLFDQIARDIKKGAIQVARPEDQTQLALEAKAEATIRPDQPMTDTVAEIRVTGPSLEVDFPERNEDFRKLIRYGLGYSWSGSFWKRKTGAFGTPENRAAETGHRLLAAGFPIRVYDADLRRRILEADFEPEPKRAVYRRDIGRFANWFALRWPYGEDYYEAARALPGARYDRPHVVVPVEHFEAVIGFAETYGFALSPGAQDLVETARAAKEAELIAPPIKPKTQAKGRAPGRVPEPLEVPEDVEIDDSLRDDD